jgi:hypothetical protein
MDTCFYPEDTYLRLEARKIMERKERLRKALVNAGYDIPEGLTLEEWIPYIERGCGHEHYKSDQSNKIS